VPIVIVLFLFGVLARLAAGGAGLSAVAPFMMFFVIGLSILATAYLSAGMYRCAFMQLRGEKISTADLFSGGDKLGKMIVASVLVAFFSFLGMVLCIIPAFIVAGALFFTIPLIVERDLGPIEAMQASREATSGDLWMFVLFAFLVGLIHQAGAYLCYIGLLVTMPLQYTITAIAFRDCFGVPGARSFANTGAAGAAGYGAPPLSGGYQPPSPQSYQPPQYGPQSYPPSSRHPYQSPPQPPSYNEPVPPRYGPPPSAVEPDQSSVPPATAPQDSPATEPIGPPAVERPKPAAGEKFCIACGAVLPATARFCARCGQSLPE